MTTFPVIFSGAMVCALIEGRKTQTRRIPTAMWKKVKPGDLLWVREGIWQRAEIDHSHPMAASGRPRVCQYLDAVVYQADMAAGKTGMPNTRTWVKRPSIHMPRYLSRLTLEVTAVRKQPLQDISWEDAIAEGIIKLTTTGAWIREPGDTAAGSGFGSPTSAFAALWDSLHGHKPGEAWDDNPAVIALTFTVHQTNVDDFLRTRTKETAA